MGGVDRMDDAFNRNRHGLATDQPPRWVAAAGVLVMSVRVFLLPSPVLWKDPILVLSAFWVFQTLMGDQKSSRALTLAAALYLIATHVWSQFPRTLETLGVLR